MATVTIALTKWVLFARAVAEVVSIMFGEAGWSELSGPIIEVAKDDCFCLSLSFVCFDAEVVALERHMGYPGVQVHC